MIAAWREAAVRIWFWTTQSVNKGAERKALSLKCDFKKIIVMDCINLINADSPSLYSTNTTAYYFLQK